MSNTPIQDTDIKVPVDGYLSPGTSDDNTWATHKAKFGQGGFEVVETIAERDDITDDRREDKMVYVRTNDDGDPAYYLWDGLSQWDDVTPKSTSTGSGSIEIDDTFTNKVVDKINVKGMRITDSSKNNELDLTAGINIHMAAPDQQYGNVLANELTLMPPLKVWDDPDILDGARVEIDKSAYEPKHNPAYLAYLNDGIKIIGKIDEFNRNLGHPTGALWFDDVFVSGGDSIQTDRDTKTYGIQETDGLDPSVTGGANFLVAYRVALKGEAKEDGSVRIMLRKKVVTPMDTEGYLTDINQAPMMVERQYKKGDKLDYLEIVGVVNAKGLKEFQCLVEHTFLKDAPTVADREDGASGILIQSLDKDSQTSRALLQFMQDTGQDIVFNSHYFEKELFDTDYLVKQNEPKTLLPQNSYKNFVDGFQIRSITDLDHEIADNALVITNNGVSAVDYHFGKLIDYSTTQLLRNRSFNATVSLENKENPFTLGLFTYTGRDDQYDENIFTGRSGDSLAFAPDWVLTDSVDIPADPNDGSHTVVKEFTVPDNAVNIAVAIYPSNEQVPSTLKLTEFKAELNEGFTHYVVKAPLPDKEKTLVYDKKTKMFRLTTGLVSSVTGYVHAHISESPEGTPIDLGYDVGGKADVWIDTKVHETLPGFAGRDYPHAGALYFSEDGKVKLTASVNLINNDSKETLFDLWWAKVSDDGTKVTKIDDSVYTGGLQAHAQNIIHTFEYEMEVQTGDRYVLYAKADGGSVWVSTNPTSNPFVTLNVEYQELQPVVSDDPWGTLDLSQFDEVYNNHLTASVEVQNKSLATFNIDVPDGMFLEVKRAIKKLDDGSIRPIQTLDYQYKDGELKVSFGQTVADAKILIGVYS